MSNSKKQRKRDCQVLSRQELYEKYVPHISQDFAKIVDKSKNVEFKQRCQLLLKVDDPSKIVEAINAKLFKLTLGDQYQVNVSRAAKVIKARILEHRAQQGTNQEGEIPSCFGDLAHHVDDDQWPGFDEHSSLPAKNVPQTNENSNCCAPVLAEMNPHRSCSTMQNSALRPPRMKGMMDSTKNYNLAEIRASVDSDDENFNSLRLHAICDEASWNDSTTVYCEDQTVPYRTVKNHPPVLQQSHARRKEIAQSGSNEIMVMSDVPNVPRGTVKNHPPVLQQSHARRKEIAQSGSNEIMVMLDVPNVPRGTVKNHSPVLQQSHAKRKEIAQTDSNATMVMSDVPNVPSGTVKSTIQTISQRYQGVLPRSGATGGKHCTTSSRGPTSSGNMKSTKQKMLQPVSPWRDTSRTRNFFTEGDVMVPFGNMRSAVPLAPHCFQPEVHRSVANTVNNPSMESDDSHFETLGNLF